MGSASAVAEVAAEVGSLMFRAAMFSSGVVEAMIRTRRRSVTRFQGWAFQGNGIPTPLSGCC